MPKPPNSPPPTILHVDDDPVGRFALSEALRRAGFEVREASTGREALRQIAEQRPDLALLDVNLPGGVSGLDVCHRLKSDPTTAPIPLLMISGQSVACEDRVRGLECGAEGYMTKPVEPAEVVAQVKSLLRAHEAEQRELEAQRRAEEATARLAALVKSSNEAITSLGFDDTILSWNPAAERLYGWSAAEAVGRPYTFHVPPDQLEEWGRVMGRVKRGEPVAAFDTVRLRKDGRRIDVSMSLSPIRDGDGRLVGISKVAHDITARKRAEAERDELLRRLKLQIERMPLAYLTHDADFRITDWNPAAERVFGYSKAEVMGRLPFDLLVPPQAAAAVRELFHRLRAGDMAAHGVTENVTKDGRTIVCEWYNTPLMGPGGTFAGLLSLAQDVTARRAAEEALRLRDRAIQAVTQGILITDPSRPDNPVIYASPGFERLTGYTTAEVLGRNCRFLQGPGTDHASVAEVREAVRAGRPCAVEVLNYRKDGTAYWNSLSISPVRDDGGGVTHFVGVLTDVTGRRRLEEQFLQAQKMEAVGQLAGGVAHDFNNLLTVIIGFGDVVRGSLPAGDPARELVREMTRAGERAAALTRQLLAFSRQSVLAPKVLDLNTVVTELEKLLRRVIGEDVNLVTRPQPDLAPVRADPSQVEQAIINLAVNARDAMPRGGKLTIETGNLDLDAACAAAHPEVRPGPYALLSVSDTGQGMTAEVKARIFEPFFTTKEKGKGTGLGLAMVYGFVRQSGGHVEVESEPGRGTTFRLYLPRAEEPASLRKSSPGLVRAPRGSETVLLVEDEGAVRALGRHVLRGSGYAVLEAGSGAEALRAAEQHPGPIHLLVTDVVLPDLGGREVAERLLARRPRLKVLFTSGYTDDAVVRHGVKEEQVHFLQKPFTPAALTRMVREVLDTPGPGP